MGRYSNKQEHVYSIEMKGTVSTEHNVRHFAN